MPISKTHPIPLPRLQESCFYPCAGSDTRPVRALWDEVRTFVLVDYGRAAQEGFADLLLGLHEDGFDVSTSGPLGPMEALGLPAWPADFFRENRPEVVRGFWDAPMWAERVRIVDRDEQAGEILYLGTEALAVYRALYASQRVSPRWLALLRPGCGFGGGWTHFWEDEPFLDLLEGNPAGLPFGLLCDDYYPGPLRPHRTPGRYESIAHPSLGHSALRTVKAYTWSGAQPGQRP